MQAPCERRVMRASPASFALLNFPTLRLRGTALALGALAQHELRSLAHVAVAEAEGAGRLNPPETFELRHAHRQSHGSSLHASRPAVISEMLCKLQRAAGSAHLS